MKKKNNKGFMLTEALVVSVLITTVLTFLYVHFKKVVNKVNDSFKYDSIQAMYSLDSIRGYIEQENYTAMVAGLDIQDYVDITNCSEYYFSNVDFCKGILNNVGIKKLFITKENMYSLLKNKTFEKDYKGIPIQTYLKTINYNKTDGYRLIAYFEDGSFANSKIFDGDSFYVAIANACTASTLKKFTVRYVRKNLYDNIIDDYVGQAGCGTTVYAQDYVDNVRDECYKVSGTPSSISISSNEKNNILTIPYEKINTQVTIKHLNGSNTEIAASNVINVECGTELDIASYILKKEGYKYMYSAPSSVIVHNKEVLLKIYYEEEGV